MKRAPLIIAVLLTIVYAAYFSWFSLGRHWKTNSGRFDLGNMEQVVWNVTHGRGFTMTDPYGTAQVSRLAFHADWLLAVLAPVYALFPRAETLLLLQTLIVASGGLAVFLIGRRLFESSWWGVLFAAMYFLNPGLQWATIFDFHPVTLAAPLILWSIWLVMDRRYWWVAVTAGLALLAKEEIGLALAAIGLYVWLVQRERRWGAILTLAPLVWSLVMLLVVLPQFRDQSVGQAEVYRTAFGTGAASIIRGAAQDPVQFLRAMTAHQNLVYGWQLFSSVGVLGLFSPWWLAATPEYVINALSLKPAQHLIISHYTSGLTPWLIASTLWGTWWVRRWLMKKIRATPRAINLALAAWLTVFTVYSVWSLSPLPRTPHDQTKFVTWRNAYARPVRDWTRRIPVAAKVSVTNDVGSQFARRQFLYSFPLGIDQADYIVVLENHATPVVATQEEVTAAAVALRGNADWQILEHFGDLTVLKRKE